MIPTVDTPLVGTDHHAMEIVKLGANIGARIDGVTVAGDLPDDVVAAVYDALLEHEVVYFRDQHHVDEQVQYAFAERLGVPTTPQNMYAAWEAGTITCFLTNPIWLVKTRMQLQAGSGSLP